MTRLTLIVVGAAAVLGPGCGNETVQVDPAYRAEIEAAWAAREARLVAEDGWLSLAGLHWLRPGPNITGSAEMAAVRLPDGPPLVGSLELDENGVVTLVPDPAAGLLVNGEPAEPMALASDGAGRPDTVQSGRAVFYLIERGDRIGVRVKDPEAPARREFTGIEHYPIDPGYRVTATLKPYAEPRRVEVPTVIGTPSVMLAPGRLHFDIDGTPLTLEPYVSSPEDRSLFIVFRDATSGVTTYGAGRFLSAERSDDSDEVVLDFNLATNPPCAFTPYATCPLPTPENALLVAVEAGEMYSGAGH